jgi:transposase InsO family protein
MRLMALEVIYQRPRTSRPAPEHRIYPYLLRGLVIERVNQVWAADITYIPMARGFLYLVVVMDWVSRYVLAWRLSNVLDSSFCVEALEAALAKGGLRSSAPIKAASSAVMTSSMCCTSTELPSAWTGVGASATISSSSGFGAASNMRRYI